MFFGNLKKIEVVGYAILVFVLSFIVNSSPLSKSIDSVIGILILISFIAVLASIGTLVFLHNYFKLNKIVSMVSGLIVGLALSISLMMFIFLATG